MKFCNAKAALCALVVLIPQISNAHCASRECFAHAMELMQQVVNTSSPAERLAAYNELRSLLELPGAHSPADINKNWLAGFLAQIYKLLEGGDGDMTALAPETEYLLRKAITQLGLTQNIIAYMDSHAAGHAVMRESQWHIGLNPEILQSQDFARFTIAHELGHVSNGDLPDLNYPANWENSKAALDDIVRLEAYQKAGIAAVAALDEATYPKLKNALNRHVAAIQENTSPSNFRMRLSELRATLFGLNHLLRQNDMDAIMLFINACASIVFLNQDHNPEERGGYPSCLESGIITIGFLASHGYDLETEWDRYLNEQKTVTSTAMQSADYLYLAADSADYVEGTRAAKGMLEPAKLKKRRKW